MNVNRYILNGHEPVEEPDLLTWAQWFEDADRHAKHSRQGLYSMPSFLPQTSKRHPLSTSNWHMSNNVRAQVRRSAREVHG